MFDNVKSWLKEAFANQEANSAGADYAFAAPEVRTAVEMNTPEGKALVRKDVETAKNGKTMDEKFAPNTKEIKAATKASPYAAFDKPTNTTALQGVVNEGETAAQSAGNTADTGTQAIQDALKDRYDAVEDYYSGSMSDAWKNLSDTDKKILLFDQLGTTLKNMSKARLPMYSAYGKSYEGQGMGEEKSMLQNMLDTSLQKGLDRRNTRLDDQMKKQLEVANFPADLEMNLTQMWESGKMNNRQKAHLIKLMSNVSFVDALKYGAVTFAANGSLLNAATGTILGHL